MGDLALILTQRRREGEEWGHAQHVRFGNTDEMAKGMTFCTAAGQKVATASSAAMIGGWITDQLPTYIAMEYAAGWDHASNDWVTGASCRDPE